MTQRQMLNLANKIAKLTNEEVVELVSLLEKKNLRLKIEVISVINSFNPRFMLDYCGSAKLRVIKELKDGLEIGLKKLKKWQTPLLLK